MRNADARFEAMALGLAALLLAAPRAWGQAEPQGLEPELVFTAGGRVLELTNSAGSLHQLWSSDGTASGTFRLPDPCNPCFDPPQFVASALGLGFFYTDSLSSTSPGRMEQLWRSNGTRAGTYPLLAAGPGQTFSSIPNGPAAAFLFQGVLYFLAVAQSGTQQLWRTDGTAAGTSLVAAVGYPAAPALTAAGGRLFFLGGATQNGPPTLWTSDGTKKGTVPIHVSSQSTSVLVAVGKRLFFNDGAALWVSDGTPAGTRAVTRFGVQGAGADLFTAPPRAVGDRLFFLANDGSHGSQVWVSDGTPAGTAAATAFTASVDFLRLEAAGSRLVFLARGSVIDQPYSVQLWATSGTPESAVALCPQGCGTLIETTPIAGAGTSGDRLVFMSFTGFSLEGTALWATDGTPAGTVMLQQACSANCNLQVQFAAAGNEVYLDVMEPSGALELWRTDGTAAGTLRFGNRAADPDWLSTARVVALGGRLFFTAFDQSSSDQLWTSDGTAAGTRQLTSGALGQSSSPPPITEFPLNDGGDPAPEGITAGPDGALWFLENRAGRVGRISFSGVLTEYSAPALEVEGIFVGIVTGPDGNLWFVELLRNAIGRITPEGVLTEFPLPTSNAIPNSVTVGPDGNIWFAEGASRKIGRITLNGSITEFPVPLVAPGGIAAGPDGNLWITELNGIARFSLTGGVKEFPLPGPEPSNIVAGPDGNLWFAGYKGNQVYRITTGGEITGFTVPTPRAVPSTVTAGPDGNVWFTEAEGNNIGRITPEGIVTEFPVPTPSARPAGITTGLDGNIWFTEFGVGQIGRLTLAAATSCVPTDATLCVDDQPGDRRWQVEVSFQTAQGGGASGSGHAIPLASLGVSNGGLFWFFGRNNPEMLLKVLNGCAANQHFWVFSSAATNVGFTVTVKDTRTGRLKTYRNSDRVPAAPVQDTGAFICP